MNDQVPEEHDHYVGDDKVAAYLAYCDDLVRMETDEVITHMMTEKVGLSTEQVEQLRADLRSATNSYRESRDVIDQLYDGVAGLDDPTTLARLRNFFEATPASGYRHA